MANIAVTSVCNLNCPYCFTQSTYNVREKEYGHMPLDIFEKSLEIIVRSGIHEISILGGEPTLHPNFIGFMEKTLEKGHGIRLFTNGYISEKALDFLSDIPEDKITIVLNINNLTANPAGLPVKIKNTMLRLNKKVLPGFNIYDKDLVLNPLIGLIETYGLKRKIRLGLAQPCIGFKNQFLPLKHYSYVGYEILKFALAAGEKSIRLLFDCGFVPCMFGDINFQEYGLDKDMGLHCDPIPDILPDGTVVSCYPLSGIVKKNNIKKSIDISGIREQMKEYYKKLHEIGIFKTCTVCNYKKLGNCTGGCTAHKTLRLNTLET